MASAAEQLASNLNWGSIGKATELKKRLWFTVGALVVFRIGRSEPEIVVRAHPGVVDQDIDGAAAQPRDHGCDAVRSGQVGRDHFEPLDLGGSDALRRSPRNDQLCAFFAQLAGKAQADAVGPSGQQDCLALKFHAIPPHCFAGD